MPGPNVPGSVDDHGLRVGRGHVERLAVDRAATLASRLSTFGS